MTCPDDKNPQVSSTAKKVLLAVCGGIAAYKACEVLRDLQKASCEVRVCMTDDARRFVGEATFEALSGHEVACGLYDYRESAIPHIDLAEWADVALVVPATANVLAKMAHGIADEVVSTTLLACPCPVVVAPGMNVHMWQNLATQANVLTLKQRGIEFVEPVAGRLACGDVGSGKLAAHEDIASAVLARLSVPAREKDLALTRVLITAGPTHEAIDPVRYIANASTGKMGYAIAKAAAERGAQVALVSGPTSLATPEGSERIDVVSAQQMLDATLKRFDSCDVAICCAAVADYTPASPADHKLKKGIEDLSRIELVKTQDILATLCGRKEGRVVVGFAAETNDLIGNAQSKLARKGADLIVANDVSRKDSTFGADTSRISLVYPDHVEDRSTQPLSDVANDVLDAVRNLLRRR